MHARTAAAIAVLALLAGCNDNPSGGGKPLTTTVVVPASDGAAPAKPASPPPAPKPDAPAAGAGDLAWDAPASFHKVDNPSKMRKATYETPKVGSDAEAPQLSVIVAGGGVDSNVDRWVGQFDDAAKSTLKREKKTVGAYEVTIVTLEGTFSGGGGMPGAPASPQAGWALLGAVVPAGDQAWFFKMTGPKASVAAARGDFDALVGSIRPAP
jgi:hypothetical protein